MDTLSLIPAFGGFAWTILAFVVALSIIVAVHEYGHYIVGRWSGIAADVFSVGFGPVIWSRVDKRGTQWQIAALPFGGYVKFRGDANAASGVDTDAMEGVEDDPAALRSTMHGAPLWARSATVAAGPIFNFIFSAIIFLIIGMTVGTVKEPLTVGDLRPLPDAETRLQPGDVIYEINGIPLPTSDNPGDGSILDDLPKTPTLEYLIERDGERMVVEAPYLFPPLVGRVVPQSAAMDAGLEAGDVITAINGEDVFRFGQLKDVIEGSDGAPVALTIWRNGDTLELTLTPRRVDELLEDRSVQTNWRIGVGAGQAFEPALAPMSFGESSSMAVQQTWRTIELTVYGLGHMLTGAMGTCNLTGPVRIAQIAGEVASQGLVDFIQLIAFLSTAIGFFNLFPIPVLDGGHLMFHAYEAATGRKPSGKALNAMMVAGLAMVLTLMVFALTMDFFCP